MLVPFLKNYLSWFIHFKYCCYFQKKPNQIKKNSGTFLGLFFEVTLFIRIQSWKENPKFILVFCLLGVCLCMCASWCWAMRLKITFFNFFWGSYLKGTFLFLLMDYLYWYRIILGDSGKYCLCYLRGEWGEKIPQTDDNAELWFTLPPKEMKSSLFSSWQKT